MARIGPSTTSDVQDEYLKERLGGTKAELFRNMMMEAITSGIMGDAAGGMRITREAFFEGLKKLNPAAVAERTTEIWKELNKIPKGILDPIRKVKHVSEMGVPRSAGAFNPSTRDIAFHPGTLEKGGPAFGREVFGEVLHHEVAHSAFQSLADQYLKNPSLRKEAAKISDELSKLRTRPYSEGPLWRLPQGETSSPRHYFSPTERQADLMGNIMTGTEGKITMADYVRTFERTLESALKDISKPRLEQWKSALEQMGIFLEP